jgi:hypothetical protein
MPADYEQSLSTWRSSIENAADAHVVAMQAMATTNACRSLPGKIRGLICAQADEFTLWVAYRQVSRLVRSEAELEFARTHLTQLRIQFVCSGKIPGI